MTTAKYIFISFIIIISYLAGLTAQHKRQSGYRNCVINTDYFYPITTMFWAILYIIFGGTARILEFFGLNGNFIYRFAFDRYIHNSTAILSLGYRVLGCMGILLYYPLVWVIFYLYKDLNIWVASPIAFVIIGLMTRGLGYMVTDLKYWAKR